MTLAVRWFQFAAAAGFLIAVTVIILTRASLLAAQLFVPIALLGLALVLTALAQIARKGFYMRVHPDGVGEIPALSHPFARRRGRSFHIGAARAHYERPIIRFDPPLLTDEGPVEKLAIEGRYVRGGASHLLAFIDYFNARSTTPEPEETEEP